MLAASDGTPAKVHLVASGSSRADATAHLDSVLPALSGQPITDLGVAGRGQTTLQLSALASLPQLTSLCMDFYPLEDGSLDALSNLTALQCLGLDHCVLGHLPAGMSSLTRLTRLTLDRNAFLGNSASLGQVLPQLTALQHLSLNRCCLKRLPDGMSALKGLTHLDLGSNYQLPPDCLDQVLQYWTAMQSLSLECCLQIGLPDAVALLTNLTYLDLGGHAMLVSAGLGVLSSLTTLQWLSLAQSWCPVGLPMCISTLTRLTCLKLGSKYHLSVDNFGNMLPHLARLRELSLESTPQLVSPGSLDNLLQAVRGLSLLQSLSLAGCSMVRVPKGITALSSLTHLDLSCNDGLSSRSLASVLAHLAALQSLNLSDCGLRKVPPSIARSTGLTRLALSRNPLGSGWQHLRPLAHLCELEIGETRLRELPRDLTSLRSLQRLNLGYNQVAGGWHHLLPLPRLRVLRTDMEVPEEVRRAIPYIDDPLCRLLI